MKKRLSKVVIGLLFATSFSTVGTFTSTYTSTVSANAHKKKAHKHNKKKKVNKHPLKVQLTKDVNEYNQTVNGLGEDINGYDSNTSYKLVSPYYSQNYSGMASSLHAMAHDMSINNVDTYDASHGVGGQINSTTPYGLNELSDSSVQIYDMFASRLKTKMSSSDFKKSSDMRDTVKSGKNQIANYKGDLYNTNDIVVTQWKNIQTLFNTLGDNVSKLK